MKIYDWANNVSEVILPDKEINEIFVAVISGDETGTVTFADDSTVHFDAATARIMNFIEGCYSVTGDEIKRWINFVPTEGETASYERLRLWG